MQNRRRLRRVSFVAACGAFLPFSICAQQNPPSRGRDVAKLYSEYCINCHGAELHGPATPDLRNGTWRHGEDDASVAASIGKGFPSTGMPAMGDNFDGPEIRGLVVYLRELVAKDLAAQTKYHSPGSGDIVQTEKAAYKLEPFIERGLEVPWAMAFLPDGRVLVTERPGRLRIIDHGKLLPEPVSGMPQVYGGEGGLLDVVLHPDYGKPGKDWIYLSYGDKSPGGLAMSAVIRGRLRDGALIDQQQIYKAPDALYRPGGQRFGSRLLFDHQDHLFVSIGDRAAPGDEQDLTQPNGKIHRFNDDGTIPKDNPFLHQKGVIASIWTYGHRNPQGLAFNPVTGDLWESEHGPRGGDELNIIHRGDNYGWPITTYGINYDGTPITDHLSHAGTVQPITHWVPSIATSPLVFYTGNKFPAWHNDLLLGSLATEQLIRIELDGRSVKHQEVLLKGIGRVRDIVNGPDGNIYLVLNSPDRIERLVPADANSTSASALSNGTPVESTRYRIR